jgi:putative chitinase
MLTISNLIAAGVPPTQARAVLVPLSAACAAHSINTPPRLAAFVAQCRVESAGFTQLEESLWYRDAARIRRIFPSRVKSLAQAQALVRNPQALANVVYANRLGNRDEASGDGWRFRGRGLKQLTGADNYRAAGEALRRPYITHPDLVAQPDDACMTAAWFWSSNGCNTLADRQEWDAITRRVNGPAMLDAARRARYTRQALDALTLLAA